MSSDLERGPSVQAVIKWMNAGAVTSQQPDAETLERVLSAAFALEQERERLSAIVDVLVGSAPKDWAIRVDDERRALEAEVARVTAELNEARSLLRTVLEYGAEGFAREDHPWLQP